MVQTTICLNNAEIDDVALTAVAPQRKIWPKAITKGYRKGLACWTVFCARRQFMDSNLVREKKILLFLKEDVLTMRTPKKGRKVGKLSIF